MSNSNLKCTASSVYITVVEPEATNNNVCIVVTFSSQLASSFHFSFKARIIRKGGSKHIEGSKERLFIMTQTHNLQIVGVIPFVTLQNDT